MVTGIVVLDRAIDGFVFEEIWDDELGCVAVSDLRDPEIARGLCDRAAVSFNRVLEQHGIEAQLTPFLASPDEFGYTDRTIAGAAIHCGSLVKHNGETLMVDWTTSQYGYSEFPFVQRLIDGVWQRKMTSDPLPPP